MTMKGASAAAYAYEVANEGASAAASAYEGVLGACATEGVLGARAAALAPSATELFLLIIKIIVNQGFFGFIFNLPG